MPAPDEEPVSAAEARSLFSGLSNAPALILAVSGGPDSTALMWLAARWRDRLKRGPQLIAVTVDHGLRPESKKEAKAVAALARTLGVEHRTLRWTGAKAATGLQQAARLARYRLLAKAARAAGAIHVLTAHTLDDQAETILFRLTRGSGLTGLAAMGRIAPVPGETGVTLVRLLLHIPKSRLVATLRAAGIAFADDPSNRDPRFTRARLRGLMPALAAEGLDAARLMQLARRLRRADAAIGVAVFQAETDLAIAAQIFGQAGHDLITGGHANDLLDGGEGVDRLWGGPGDDLIRGACAAGIRKVNVGTLFNSVLTQTIRQHLENDAEVLDPRAYMGRARDAVTAEASRLLAAISGR